MPTLVQERKQATSAEVPKAISASATFTPPCYSPCPSIYSFTSPCLFAPLCVYRHLSPSPRVSVCITSIPI